MIRISMFVLAAPAVAVAAERALAVRKLTVTVALAAAGPRVVAVAAIHNLKMQL